MDVTLPGLTVIIIILGSENLKCWHDYEECIVSPNSFDTTSYSESYYDS